MNPRLAELAPSLIRALNARKRPGDIDLGLGEPTFRPDPAPFDAAMAWVRAHGLPYSPNAGFDALREAIAAHHGLPCGAAAANALVTVGSEEALYLALKTLADPARDEVLLVEPGYLAYAKLCRLEGIPHRAVALSAEDGFAPRAATVLGALRPETRVIVLNTPANPTARVWPEAELRALADGLAARPGPPTWVIADEVYRELWYGDAPPASMARLHPRTVTLGSLSKSSALTGLRLGWLVGPAEAVAAAAKVHALVATAAGTFGQRVALALLETPGALSSQRARYAERRALLLERLARLGLAHAPVEGAFYAFLRLPPSLAHDSLGVAERLLEAHRVVTVPGVAFGAGGEGWLRLSWVAEPDALLAGLDRIAAFLSSAI